MSAHLLHSNSSDLKAGSSVSAPEFASSAAVFEFVDAPPAPTHGRNPIYRAFADALRENPGRWAVWPGRFKNRSSTSAQASNIKRGTLRNFPEGEFDAVTREGKLYVRFIGGQS